MLPRIWSMQRSKRNITHHEMQIPIRSKCTVELPETCDGKAEGSNSFEHGGIPTCITIASLLGSTRSGCPTRCVDSLNTSRRR